VTSSDRFGLSATVRTLPHCLSSARLTPLPLAEDVRVNYQTLLRWLRADIVQLRQTYGSQPLRGYGPELDRDEEGSDKEGGDEEDDPLQEAKLSFTGKSEEEWASIVFDPGRFAKFFDNRFNEGYVLFLCSSDRLSSRILLVSPSPSYTPTLTIAPRTAASLLKFFLTRQVFPKQTLRIKVCLKVCEIASKQRASSLSPFFLSHAPSPLVPSLTCPRLRKSFPPQSLANNSPITPLSPSRSTVSSQISTPPSPSLSTPPA
jgi:hypothetical protein